MRSVSFTLLFIMIGLVATAAPALAQDQTKVFEEAYAKVKTGDTASIDFKALRMAYAGSKYAEGQVDPKMMTKLRDDSKTKNFASIAKTTAEILQVEPLNPTIYIYAATAAQALGDKKKADVLTAVYVGLVNSIIGSGDGNSTKTAYVVISSDEEVAVLNQFQLQKTSREAVTEEGHKFDVITVLDKSNNQTSKIYFNIDLLPAPKQTAEAKKP